MAKEIKFSDHARKQMVEGVNTWLMRSRLRSAPKAVTW